MASPADPATMLFECLLKLREACLWEVVRGVTEEPWEAPLAASTAVDELSLLVSMSSDATTGASIGFRAPFAGFDEEDICII